VEESVRAGGQDWAEGVKKTGIDADRRWGTSCALAKYNALGSRNLLHMYGGGSPAPRSPAIPRVERT